MAFDSATSRNGRGSKSAQSSSDQVELITQFIGADTWYLQTIFKDIHQNPELGFTEVHTSGILAEELKELGYEVQTGIGKTGVVGNMRNGDGPIVMYRASMSANAVGEETGLAYASTVRVLRNDGSEVLVAQLCGHDAHTTWMLGMAKFMAMHKEQLERHADPRRPAVGGDYPEGCCHGE